MIVKCAECQCVPQYCTKVTDVSSCNACTKEICCCVEIHTTFTSMKLAMMPTLDDCCSTDTCKTDMVNNTKSHSRISQFLRNAKKLYAAALGIEILCITAAEIGENMGLYIFGLNPVGIAIAFVMGYSFAGFTTFTAILGRYNNNEKIDSCCSVLEHNSQKGFLVNLVSTFKDFAIGIKRIPKLYRVQNRNQILKSTAYILVTAESACILTAEVVDLVLYKHSFLLGVALALVAGAFAVVAPQAYKMTHRQTHG
ncbi:MAG: hypothetical protein K8Q89_07620 [Nitrosarchaeum sp.]|nr:hypothetical protein [Nitrosarchaeum sp.]